MIRVEPHTATRSWMVVSDGSESAFAELGFETKNAAVEFAREQAHD